LKLVVARGLGTLDLPPFTSLEDFADAHFNAARLYEPAGWDGGAGLRLIGRDE
jgi:hypothetical protein